MQSISTLLENRPSTVGANNFSQCSLCLCGDIAAKDAHHGDTEDSEDAQRKRAQFRDGVPSGLAGFRGPVLIAIALLALAGLGCSRKPTVIAPPSVVNNPPAGAAPLRGTETSMTAVRFLENRIKTDPDDLVALNKLANYYLQLYRETYDVAYLGLALRSARSSLGVLGADQNLSGLLVL